MKAFIVVCFTGLLIAGCSTNNSGSTQQSNVSEDDHPSSPTNSGDLCGKMITINKENLLDYLNLRAGCAEIYNPYSTNTYELKCETTSLFKGDNIEENTVKYDCDVTVYYYDSSFTNLLSYTFKMTESIATEKEDLPNKTRVYEIKNEIKVNSASGYFKYSKQCHTVSINVTAENYQNYLKISPMSFDSYNTNEDYRNHYWLSCSTNNSSLKFFGFSNLSFTVISSYTESGRDETTGQWTTQVVEKDHVLRCGSLLRTFIVETKSSCRFYLKNVSGMIYLDSQLSYY